MAAIDLDPWGGETARSWNSAQQSRKFATYERDGSGNDQAMLRQYHAYWMRFDQPDPYGGSYDVTDPQSLNRYSYVQNDPVNFVDPTGLNMASPGTRYGECPPGSVVCGSGEKIGARVLLEGFNFIWYWHGEVLGSVMRHAPFFGSLFGPLEAFEGPQKTERETPQERRQRLAKERKQKLQDCLDEAMRLFREERAKIPRYGFKDALPGIDDFGGGAITGGVTLAAKIYGGAKLGASLAGGVGGFALGLAGTYMFKLGRHSLQTALAADETTNNWKARRKECEDKYGDN